jgi:hypothetical protein
MRSIARLRAARFSCRQGPGRIRFNLSVCDRAVPGYKIAALALPCRITPGKQRLRAENHEDSKQLKEKRREGRTLTQPVLDEALRTSRRLAGPLACLLQGIMPKSPGRPEIGGALHEGSSRRGPRDPGLSHHRTCRSAYGGSRKTNKTPMLHKEAHEPLLCKPLDRYRCVHVGSAGIPPRPVAIINRGIGAGLINTPFH